MLFSYKDIEVPTSAFTENEIIGRDGVSLKDLKDIERSIQTKYRSRLWSPFIHALKEFEMVNEGDKIAVAISGGKDSLLLAKLFQELKRHSKINFEIVFIAGLESN